MLKDQSKTGLCFEITFEITITLKDKDIIKHKKYCNHRTYRKNVVQITTHGRNFFQSMQNHTRS